MIIASISTDIILLTKSCVISFLCPVICCHIVCLTIPLVCSAKCGIWIQFAVKANKVLSFRNCVDIVTQVVHHCCVSPLVGFSCRKWSSIRSCLKSEIVQLCIICLIIFGRILYTIVIHYRTSVGTPFYINGNLSFTALTLLSCNNDYTTCTTCTIQCCRSSILKY